jgi:hypothetical protein
VPYLVHLVVVKLSSVKLFPSIQILILLFMLVVVKEEIGVEHLLKDVKDRTISTLATKVSGKLTALKGLEARLRKIHGYLDLVIDGKLPLNHEILYHLQDVFNLLPNLIVK